MSTAADLAGLGMPAALANRLGGTFAQVNAATTAQATGTVLVNTFSRVVTSGGQTAVVLPADAPIGSEYNVWNSGGTAAIVFPHLDGTINNQTANTSFSVAQNKPARFTRYTTVIWVASLSA